MNNSESTRCIALLRGINVGGKHIIKMADLKTSFENMGFGDVITYIQSGNVLFNCENSNLQQLSITIEKHLSERFDYFSKVVLLTQQKLSDIIREAPATFGYRPEEYRYDVIFLRDPLTPEEVVAECRWKEGTDFVSPGSGVVYFSRKSNLSSQSQMTKLIGTGIYQEMTIRNWNTVLKLAGL